VVEGISQIKGCDGNDNGKDQVDKHLDNPPCFSATIHSTYLIPMAADKQIQAVQEATVLQSGDYTKDGMKCQYCIELSSPTNFFVYFSA
jgi:hypothetical protein